MVLDAGRGDGELAEELLVDQEALGQGAEVRVAHGQQHLAEPRHQLADVLRALGQELLGLDPRAVDRVDVREDDLERALEDLRLAADPQVVARLERARQLLGRVPEPGPDAPRLVAELQLQVEVPLAIGPELLVGDQEDLVDRVPMSQLVDVATAHAHSFQSFPLVAGTGAGETSRRGRCPSSGRL